MLDKEKLAYDLAVIYAQDVLRNRPKEMMNCSDVNKLLLDGFNTSYEYQLSALGLTEIKEQ